MLILTRRIGETIKIGDDIDVTVLGVKGQQVRIGVSAPKDKTVHRQEVYDRLQGKKPHDITPGSTMVEDTSRVFAPTVGLKDSP